MNPYDEAVIGGGAAELPAAPVLTRAHRRVADIDATAVVICGLMPYLHKARVRILTTRSSS